jgi:hypothetical protein
MNAKLTSHDARARRPNHSKMNMQRDPGLKGARRLKEREPRLKLGIFGNRRVSHGYTQFVFVYWSSIRRAVMFPDECVMCA